MMRYRIIEHDHGTREDTTTVVATEPHEALALFVALIVANGHPRGDVDRVQRQMLLALMDGDDSFTHTSPKTNRSIRLEIEPVGMPTAT